MVVKVRVDAIAHVVVVASVVVVIADVFAYVVFEVGDDHAKAEHGVDTIETAVIAFL